VLEAIKSAPDTRDLRVIIHSSHALNDALTAQLLAAGAEAIIEKGFTDLEQMRARVAQLIGWS
jgi:CheY-like chemotaxis protein